MASVVVWQCGKTGVSVSWNKDGPYTTFNPHRVDERCVTHGSYSSHLRRDLAIRAGRRIAQNIIQSKGL